MRIYQALCNEERGARCQSACLTSRESRTHVESGRSAVVVVIVKPSEEASLVMMRIVELALEAGIPEGVLQIVTGGGVVGRALAGHQDVDCITFTGSTATHCPHGWL
jgi:Aldehyde dehydrogenase family